MDWVTFGTGAFVGALLFDLLWRVTFWLTSKLLDEQRELISEQRKVIDSLYQVRGRL